MEKWREMAELRPELGPEMDRDLARVLTMWTEAHYPLISDDEVFTIGRAAGIIDRIAREIPHSHVAAFNDRLV
jgi:hypothetical protein